MSAPNDSYLFRADYEDLKRWKNAARKEGVPFSVWLREAADAKANNDPPARTRPNPARVESVAPARPFRPDFKKTGRGDVR